MPEFPGSETSGGGQGQDRDSGRHGPAGLPPVGHHSGKRRQQAIEENVQGEHDGNVAPAPPEFFQNGGKEDGEGMADAVDQHHCDDADPDDLPSVKGAGFPIQASRTSALRTPN